MINAINVNNTIARISRSEIIVSGEISSSNILVAMNEAPQNNTAIKGRMYMYFLICEKILLPYPTVTLTSRFFLPMNNFLNRNE